MPKPVPIRVRSCRMPRDAAPNEANGMIADLAALTVQALGPVRDTLEAGRAALRALVAPAGRVDPGRARGASVRGPYPVLDRHLCRGADAAAQLGGTPVRSGCLRRDRGADPADRLRRISGAAAGRHCDEPGRGGASGGSGPRLDRQFCDRSADLERQHAGRADPAGGTASGAGGERDLRGQPASTTSWR